MSSLSFQTPKTLMFAYIPEVLTSLDVKRLIHLKCPQASVESVSIHYPRHRIGYLQAKVLCTHANNVIDSLNGHEFLGRKLIVDWSRDAAAWEHDANPRENRPRRGLLNQHSNESTATMGNAHQEHHHHAVSARDISAHARKKMMHQARRRDKQDNSSQSNVTIPQYVKDALEKAATGGRRRRKEQV
uniref:RRM domain-containing protein n=1 Tax=Percolomonas cosmopolitus TaxID=63605 RepID=A0A7S1PI31_9EUKA